MKPGHRTGFHANDAYSAYIEMGSPKHLDAAQIAHPNELTGDLPKTGKTVNSSPNGTIEILKHRNTNDTVFVKLMRSGADM